MTEIVQSSVNPSIRFNIILKLTTMADFDVRLMGTPLETEIP